MCSTTATLHGESIVQQFEKLTTNGTQQSAGGNDGLDFCRERAVMYGQNGDGRGDHERRVTLARIQIQDTVDRLVQRLMNVPVEYYVRPLVEVAKQVFRRELRSAPGRVRYSDAHAFDLQHFNIRQGTANVRRVRVAMHGNGFPRDTPHPVHHIHAYEVAAVNRDVSLCDLSPNVRMHLFPLVAVGIGKNDDTCAHTGVHLITDCVGGGVCVTIPAVFDRPLALPA